ncbi:MAG: LOG family protein [Ignavibacteria bacterium]|nr:LOG family protein [Ignavibacteria bacterium]MBI3765695.1 LOG family protein [Ignavibacteriales bacterium]
MSVITIFGSSRPHSGEPEYETARELGGLLANSGYDICNGGYGGTMEATAQGAREAGGKTIGVVAKYFSLEANPYIVHKFVTTTLTDRLMKLIELGDAYVVLKGSTGTLFELAAVWEFMNKNIIHSKPIVVVGNFWTPVVNSLGEELTHEGRDDVTTFVTVVKSPGECVNILNTTVKRR